MMALLDIIGCCSLLQCGAVRCSVLQYEKQVNDGSLTYYRELQCVAVCCSVLQCGAVYCSIRNK